MNTFIFIRHGKFDRFGDDLDPLLTPVGISEATAAAAYLVDHPIAQVYGSPLARAGETAKIIAETLGLSALQDVRLRERANFGDLPSQTVDEFIAMWEHCNVERSWIPPVGDSSEDCGRRVEAFVADMYEHQPQGTIIAASHGGAIADFLLNVFTLDEIAAANPALAATPYSGDVMRECSITIIRYDGHRYLLDGVAEIDHLEP